MTLPSITTDVDEYHENALSEARTALIVKCCFWAHLLHDRMTLDWSYDLPTAGTDDKHIFVNPDWFAGLTVSERVFVLAHETAHGMFGHMGRMLMHKSSGYLGIDFDFKLFNVYADYIINDLLIDCGVGSFIKSGLHDRNIATYEDVVEDVYKKQAEEGHPPPEQQPGDGENSPGEDEGGHGGFDVHMEPGQGGGDGEPADNDPRDDAAWQHAVAQAAQLERIQGRGTMPASLRRIVDRILEPTIPWGQRIRYKYTKCAGRDESNWSRPNRRMLTTQNIVMPGPVSYALGHIVIGIDTSGSIRDPALAQFMGEQMGIFNDLRPKLVTCIWCDARVQKVQEFTEAGDLQSVRMHPGGGGTKFKPVFDYVEEKRLEPDVLVYFTDLCGDQASLKKPFYPVIWATIRDGEAPFGDIVKVNLRS